MASCQPEQIGDLRVCSGFESSGQTLFDYWCQYDCPGAYSNYLNTLPNGAAGYNAQRLPATQSNITHLFNTYLSTNQITDNVQSPSYNSFQQQLLSLCNDPRLPGVCDAFLQQYCGGVSRERASSSLSLTQFCGCYVPPDSRYQAAVTDWNVNCDPLCHRTNTVQKADPATGATLQCSPNVCVIDDVTINLAQSQIGGDVTFANICPTCSSTGTSGCFCLISGININQTLEDVGIEGRLQQYCGPRSQCLQLDGQGNVVNVGCQQGVPPPPPAWNTTPSLLFIGLVGLIVVVVLLAFAAASHR